MRDPAAGDGAAKAAIPDGKGPATVLSDTPVNAPDLAKTKAEVAAAACRSEEDRPRLRAGAHLRAALEEEAVADIETFAKAHKMSEAQAKQVLAREDMRITEAQPAVAPRSSPTRTSARPTCRRPSPPPRRCSSS